MMTEYSATSADDTTDNEMCIREDNASEDESIKSQDIAPAVNTFKSPERVLSSPRIRNASKTVSEKYSPEGESSKEDLSSNTDAEKSDAAEDDDGSTDEEKLIIASGVHKTYSS